MSFLLIQVKNRSRSPSFSTELSGLSLTASFLPQFCWLFIVHLSRLWNVVHRSSSEYALLRIFCYQWIHMHEKNSQWCETLMGCFHQQSNETSLADENTPLWVPTVFWPILLPHGRRDTSNHGCVNICMYCDSLLCTDKCVCRSP